MTISVSLVTAELRAIALQLLFARFFPLEEQPTRVEDALRSADQGGLNLKGLLLAREDDLPVGAALMMNQADSVALVWPPVVSNQVADAPAVEQALMARLCEGIESSGAKLAQALINADDVSETVLLQSYGFAHSADLFFMARHLSPEDSVQRDQDHGMDSDESLPEMFDVSNADRFAATVELTYRESLDCQFLNGLRTGMDAVASHRLSGQFDPQFWRLYSEGSIDAGVLMMNPHPDQNGMELVYLGVVPEFRGRGLGRRMLAEGIRTAAMSGQSMVFLAVDCGNTYANELYSEFGFVELATTTGSCTTFFTSGTQVIHTVCTIVRTG